MELQESMRTVRATVAEQSNDLASFLEEMHSSAKEFLDEVMKEGRNDNRDFITISFKIMNLSW